MAVSDWMFPAACRRFSHEHGVQVDSAEERSDVMAGCVNRKFKSPMGHQYGRRLAGLRDRKIVTGELTDRERASVDLGVIIFYTAVVPANTKVRNTKRLVIRCECDENQSIVLDAVLRILSWSLADYAKTALRDLWLYRFAHPPEKQPDGKIICEILLSEKTLLNIKPEYVISRIQDKWRNLQARQPVESPDGRKPSMLDAQKNKDLNDTDLPIFTIVEQDGFSIRMPLIDELNIRIRYWKLLFGLAWARFLGRQYY